MADKFKIPESFKPKNKIFATPRVGVTIGISKAAGYVKTAIIKSSIAGKLDENPDYSITSAMLGTPVYDAVIIKKTLDTSVGLSPTGEDYALFESGIVTINQSRNIVSTSVQGRNGTIKEYISDNDFEINIKCVIASQYAERAPKEDMENVLNLLTQQNEIVIISDYLSLFKIQYAVVQQYSFSQVEGTLNQIQMDLKLLSDEPIELKLGIDPDA